ncbi:hypothetical protein [Fischerella thermalis]|nr:hypothetical protein [Fischerella thermalis]
MLQEWKPQGRSGSSVANVETLSFPIPNSQFPIPYSLTTDVSN